METFSKYVTEIFGEYVMEILEVFLPVTQDEKTCDINVSSDKIGYRNQEGF